MQEGLLRALKKSKSAVFPSPLAAAEIVSMSGSRWEMKLANYG
ncbi:MAG: hypothetical protein WC003_14045 [Terrimicrobiaceae bacterium]